MKLVVTLNVYTLSLSGCQDMSAPTVKPKQLILEGGVCSGCSLNSEALPFKIAPLLNLVKHHFTQRKTNVQPRTEHDWLNGFKA